MCACMRVHMFGVCVCVCVCIHMCPMFIWVNISKQLSSCIGCIRQIQSVPIPRIETIIFQENLVWSGIYMVQGD